MSTRFAALAAELEQAQPQSNGPMEMIPGRVLLADGDGLAYYCAGKDGEVSPGEAKAKLVDKLQSAARACGAEYIRILLTSRGSHKGYRYAVARSKPYQGQRVDSRRPQNWQFLRELMENGGLTSLDMQVESTHIAEADDLFSKYLATGGDYVCYTQDKDMQMCYGWHLDWLSHILFKVEQGQWYTYANDKVWGRAWFWSQILHGDGADNIPGLPFYTDGSITKTGPNKGKVKEIKVGVSAEPVKALHTYVSDMGALLVVKELYQSCYRERWLVELLEQGILLWMRTDIQASVFDVVVKGNPLHPLTTHELYPAARDEIMLRVAKAMTHEKTEDDGSSDDQSGDAGGAEREVCNLQTPVQPDAGSAGSQPLDGADPGVAASGVQCSAGQGGEQLQAVRCAQPVGVPQWARRLLAKA
jgi:DNA polymerase-1